ncbi:MAG: hypothetical protein HYX51_10335 [Chloroflexi bacterium]|nr:hypothetical protein [Chloroflexota bacterium]
MTVTFERQTESEWYAVVDGETAGNIVKDDGVYLVGCLEPEHEAHATSLKEAKAILKQMLSGEYGTPDAESAPAGATAKRTQAEISEASKAKDNETPAECLCGCGIATKRRRARFVPGHDAKLKSMLLSVEKYSTAKAASDAATTDEEKAKVPTAPSEAVYAVIANVRALGFLSECSCCGQGILPHATNKGPICRTSRCRCSGGGPDEDTTE